MIDLQRVGPITEVVQVLRDISVDPDDVLVRAGLRPGDLDSTDNMIPFSAVGQLLQACVDATRRPDFGLLVGERARPHHFGQVGRLVENAPNLGAALRDSADHQNRYVRGSALHLIADGDTIFWTYSVYRPGIQATDLIADFALAIGFSVLRAICGITPEAVWLPRKAPADAAAYRAYYGMTPRFDAELAALVFPTSAAQQPLPKADPHLRRALEASVSEYWAITEPDIPARVLRLLRSRVLLGEATEEAVAEVMSMHSRTLKRQLRTAGTSFRELVNETRFEVARQLLVGTRMPLTQIALALQYADSTGFSRAFRARAGVSPSEWRHRSLGGES